MMAELQLRMGYKRRLIRLHALLLILSLLIAMFPTASRAAADVSLNVTGVTENSATFNGQHFWTSFDTVKFYYMECPINEGDCDPEYDGTEVNGTPSSGGAFSATVTNLNPGTRYTVKAYVYDESSFYSDIVAFETPGGAPDVRTLDSHVVYAHKAVIGTDYRVSDYAADGILVATQGDAATLTWSTEFAGVGSLSNYNYLSPPASDTGGTRKYVLVSDLNPETTYYYRAYVRTTDDQVVYGDIKQFTTTPAPVISAEESQYVELVNTPILIPLTVTDPGFNPGFIPGGRTTPEPIDYEVIIEENTAGTVVAGDSFVFDDDDNGYPELLTVTPETNITGTATIKVKLTRAGEIASSQSIELTWNPPGPVKPTVVTRDPSNVRSDRAGLELEVTSDGGSALTNVGFVLSTDANDPLEKSSDSWVVALSVVPNQETYEHDLTSLTPGTTYYLRAFAENGVGISYGAKKSFTARLKPSLSAIPDQTVYVNESIDPQTFTISDPQFDQDPGYDYSDVLIAVSIENLNGGQLLDATSVVVSVYGDTRTVTVTPIANRTGAANVQLSFENADGEIAETKFRVTVNAIVTSTPIATEQKQVKIIVSDPAQGGQNVDMPITDHIGAKVDIAGEILDADGNALNLSAIRIDANGNMTMPNVAAGEYKVKLYVVAPTGEQLAGQIGKLKVDQGGNVTLEAELIDPYGTITNKYTGEIITDAKVTLYWSDTELNRSKGRTPNGMVVLPILPDFPPNQNKDPQYSDSTGQYAWMVFPDGDYYIIAEKDGYEVFDSRKDPRDEVQGEDSYIRNGLIHVGVSIVHYDIQMTPNLAGQGTHKPYMNGYPDGTFKPDRGITRAEMAAILGRLFTNNGSGSTVSFTDVRSSHWAGKAISAAVAEGWMNGYPGNVFKPERMLTRAEFAQVLLNVLKWEPVSDTSYKDISGHWAKAAVATAAKQGVFDSLAGSMFHPDQTIKRSEIVTILNKLLDRHPVNIPTSTRWKDTPESRADYRDIMEASIEHPYGKLEDGTEVWINP